MATATEYITTIASENTDKIADFELLLSEEFKPFIVLTGDNGAGKTWLLHHIYQAIAQSTYYKKNIPEGVFTVIANDQETSRHHYVYNVSNEFEELSLHSVRPLTNKLAVYNASRLVIQSIDSTVASKDKRVFNPFDESRMLLNVEQWFILKVVAGREDLVKSGIEVLQTLMPNVKKIDYKRDDKEGIIFQYHTEHGIESLNTLSAGNKVVLAMIGDLFFRLWDQQLDTKEAKDLTGVVIIDEIEAHLHPKWQRAFPKLLNEVFPNVQFIVSTHTPMTILGLPKNCILLHVDTNKEGKITVEKQDLDYWNMLPQQILTAPLFGLDSLRSLYNEELGDLHTEDDYQALKKSEEVSKTIKEWAQHFKAKKLGND